jgi:arsenate reductase
MGRRSQPSVLFLCSANSCRSQMAEGWARALYGNDVEVLSAGVEARGVDARAIAVMREAGVDISGQNSKTVDRYLEREVDLVVTVCEQAAERCAAFPRAIRLIHHSFADPARASGSRDEVLAVFRTTRDEIRDFVRKLPELLPERSPDAGAAAPDSD